MTAAAPRSAVIFRTHFWDPFVERQFHRIRARSEGCDLFVLIDETAGPAGPIPHDHVLSITAPDLLAQGYADAGTGHLLWFNGDYPIYALLDLAPGYDSYIVCEYDAIISLDLASFAAQAAREAIDFVGLSKGEPTPQWYWLPTCLAAYPDHDIRHQLICIALFSAAALRHLRERRLALSADFKEGKLSAWPMCEGFIPTELALAGMRMAELSRFGDTTRYDHWPPYLEDDPETRTPRGFIHPVLDPPRYIESLLKYHVGISGYLDPNSLFHRKLRRLPAPLYLQAVTRSFAEKMTRNLRRALAPAGHA